MILHYDEKTFCPFVPKEYDRLNNESILRFASLVANLLFNSLDRIYGTLQEEGLVLRPKKQRWMNFSTLMLHHQAQAKVSPQFYSKASHHIPTLLNILHYTTPLHKIIHKIATLHNMLQSTATLHNTLHYKLHSNQHRSPAMIFSQWWELTPWHWPIHHRWVLLQFGHNCSRVLPLLFLGSAFECEFDI